MVLRGDPQMHMGKIAQQKFKLSPVGKAALNLLLGEAVLVPWSLLPPNPPEAKEAARICLEGKTFLIERTPIGLKIKRTI